MVFDDDRAVANAGLALVVMCSEALGIEDAANEVVDLGERAGASGPSRKEGCRRAAAAFFRWDLRVTDRVGQLIQLADAVAEKAERVFAKHGPNIRFFQALV